MKPSLPQSLKAVVAAGAKAHARPAEPEQSAASDAKSPNAKGPDVKTPDNQSPDSKVSDTKAGDS